MSFASTRSILKKARKNKYAVGAFNINNMEILQSVVRGASKLKSPVILQTSEGAIKYAGLDYLYEMSEAASRRYNVPIALHLDHGRDIELIKKCIKVGYSSVMIDGSYLNFDENVRVTKKVVNMAHREGLSVEGELGTIGGVEDSVRTKNIKYTDPTKAEEFVSKTGVDFLAVAIGTSHGIHKYHEGGLRMDILKKIGEGVRVPLVLHGASRVDPVMVKKANKYGASLKNVVGIKDSEIKKAIRLGVGKINTDTDLRIAFDTAVRKFLMRNRSDFDPRHILKPARELMQEVVEGRIKLFGSKER